MPDKTPIDAVAAETEKPGPAEDDRERPENPFTHSERTDTLEARNRFDDARQTRAEDRITSNEVTLRDLLDMAKDNRDAVATASRDMQFSIRQAAASLNSRLDTQGERIRDFDDTLKAQRLEYLTKIGQVTAASVGAIPTSQLAPTMIGQLARSKIVWALMAIPALVFAPIVVDHWALLVERTVHFGGYMPF